MGIESILHVLEVESAGECEEILTAARGEAQRILGQAREEVESRKGLVLEAELRAVRAEQARLMNAARLSGLRDVAVARDQVVDSAFAEAEVQLRRVRESQRYQSVFRRLLREAVDEIGARSVVIRVDPGDVELAVVVAAELRLDARVEPTLPCAGGLEASDADGRIRVVNTIESRLQRARDLLKNEIVSEIEGGLEDSRAVAIGS